MVPDRDVRLAIGRWGWLHVRTLVEEHAAGHIDGQAGQVVRFAGNEERRRNFIGRAIVGGIEDLLFCAFVRHQAADLNP